MWPPLWYFQFSSVSLPCTCTVAVKLQLAALWTLEASQGIIKGGLLIKCLINLHCSHSNNLFSLLWSLMYGLSWGAQLAAWRSSSALWESCDQVTSVYGAYFTETTQKSSDSMRIVKNYFKKICYLSLNHHWWENSFKKNFSCGHAFL